MASIPNTLKVQVPPVVRKPRAAAPSASLAIALLQGIAWMAGWARSASPELAAESRPRSRRDKRHCL